MTDRLTPNRREFVIAVAAAGGGMAIGVRVPGGIGAALAAEGDVQFGQFVIIGADDTVTVRSPVQDTGHGGHDLQAQFVCEELSCDWPKIKVVHAPYTDALKAMGNTINYKRGIPNREVMQQAGASARERLIAAAATELNVPVAELAAKDGSVVHGASGRKLSYGKLAGKAANIKLDKEPAIKKPDQYTLLGKSLPKDLAPVVLAKVNGSAIFGIDVKLPGMWVAAIKQSPVMGGQVRKFDAAAVMNRPGVRAVVELGKPGTSKAGADNPKSRLQSQVAVLADTWWQAKSALDVLPIEWDDGPGAELNTADYFAKAHAMLDKPGIVAFQRGDAPAALKSAAKTIEGVYQAPLLEHAIMEPLSAVAHVQADRVDIWVGSQQQDRGVQAAAEETGLPLAKVFMHEVHSGGGFGRKTINDDTRQAVALSREVGRPVKVLWSREESMREGAYRPPGVIKLQAGIGPDGMPTALFARIVQHDLDLYGSEFPGMEPKDVKAGSVAPFNLPAYTLIPNVLAETHTLQLHVRTHPLRGSQPTAGRGHFMLESFIDEIAHAGGKDPVELRRTLLRDAKDPGWLKTLNEVADKSGWGKKTFPKGTAQGLAVGNFGAAIAAGVATVSVSREGAVRVERVDMAVDLGHVMNPNGVDQQVMGGVVYGVSGALGEEITIKKGRIVEGNFDDYPILRMDEAPVVVNHFGGNTGGSKFESVGEPPAVTVGAAIGNAIFRATGKRVRSLPIRHHDLSWG